MLEQGQGSVAGDLYKKGYIKIMCRDSGRAHPHLAHIFKILVAKWALREASKPFRGGEPKHGAELAQLLSSGLGAMSRPASHPVPGGLKTSSAIFAPCSILWFRLTPSHHHRSSPVELFKGKKQGRVRRQAEIKQGENGKQRRQNLKEENPAIVPSLFFTAPWREWKLSGPLCKALHWHLTQCWMSPVSALWILTEMEKNWVSLLWIVHSC